MTSLLDLLRGRAAKQTADAATDYWSLMHRISRGARPDAKTAEQLEAAAGPLKKSLADIETDLQLSTQLHGLGDIEGREREVSVERATLLEQAAAAETDAAALAARANERQQEAERARRTASRLQSEIDYQKQERMKVLRELDRRGYAPATEELARRRAEAELQQVRERIATLEREIEAGEARAARTDPQTAAAVRQTLAAPRTELGRMKMREGELLAETKD